MAATAKVEWVYRAGQAHPCALCGWAGQQVLAVLVDGSTESQLCADDVGCVEGRAEADHLDGMYEEWLAQQRAEAGLGWE